MPTETLPVRIKSSLPDSQELLLHWMTGTEELGRPFRYELEIYCKKDVEFQSVLGHPLTVSFEKEGGTRSFNGVVTRFAKVGAEQRYLTYRAVLSPRLWLLRNTRDTRVFQNLTVAQIVKQVLGDHSVKFMDRLQHEYRRIDYVCQYRESTFNFLSRLMEKEGIYYYFKHIDEEHVVVLSDGLSSHEEVPSYDKLPVFDTAAADASGDHLTDWHVSHNVRSAAVTLEDHDFRLWRGADIKATKASTGEHDGDEWQVYDYRGAYLIAENKDKAEAGATRTAGEHYAAVALDERRATFERFQGEAQARGLETGALFRIDAPDVVDKQLLVVTTHHQIRNIELQSGGAFDPVDDIAQVSFSAIDSKRQFRPERSTPQPVAAGPDTATVVGAKGEEIWTDRFGRIRIQFHWDRNGKDDESSTCWVRVSQLAAGSQWGAQFIPRIGHEVVVQYLGGDPDRPIVIGSLYNANNMPPYDLPANATQSGIKTRSSKGGGPQNFNEIRFEDKKGSEELFVHAEKTHTVKVKGSRSLSVGGSESISVGGERTTTVTKNDTVTLKAEHTMTVTGLTTHNMNKGYTRDVYGGDETVYIDKAKTEFVGQHFFLESAEELMFQVAGSTITIGKLGIKIKAPKITIDGETVVDVKGAVVKLNSP